MHSLFSFFLLICIANIASGDKSCPNDCSNHGTCNITSLECICNMGFITKDCSVKKIDVITDTDLKIEDMLLYAVIAVAGCLFVERCFTAIRRRRTGREHFQPLSAITSEPFDEDSDEEIELPHVKTISLKN